MYQNINSEIEIKIQKIIEGNYEFSLLGTNGKENFPSISKILPMLNKNILYVLLSDLSEHTQNINDNNKVSFYFSVKENNKVKLNNPRLTLNGKIKKIKLDKKNKIFLNLLNAYEKVDKGSKMWGMFIDFNFYEFRPERALFIEGFGKAYLKQYNQ
jgi:CTP:phosphocholine cytidylyltransferase-like protein